MLLRLSQTGFNLTTLVVFTLVLAGCGGGGGGSSTPITTPPNSNTYSIGGTVYGLTGTGLVLQNNGGDNMTVTANGSGSFTTHLSNGAAYSVIVLTQPSGQACAVTNGSGTVAGANVANVSVVCAATTAALTCIAGNGSGYQGITLYTPNNIFGYQLSTTIANAPDVVTLDWGAAYTGSLQGAYTGSLKASLWAVSSSYSGGGINGHTLGTFIPNFSGTGAFSTSQLTSGGYSTNTIVSSTTSYNPPSGTYCLVIILAEYSSTTCPDPTGYCVVDWLQLGNQVTFY